MRRIRFGVDALLVSLLGSLSWTACSDSDLDRERPKPSMDGGDERDAGAHAIGDAGSRMPRDASLPTDALRDAAQTDARAGAPVDAAAASPERDGSAPNDASTSLGDLRDPADLLDLQNWKLTLPIETPHPGNPDEYLQPELASFSIDPYFLLSDAKDAVVFRGHAGGATTNGSGYPRSELREMTNGATDEASWSTSEGTHSMTIRQAITHVTPVKPHVVAGQIHDADDDVVMIRLEDRKLFVEANGDEVAILDDDYSLGTIFTVQLTASGGHIQVFYDGELKADLERAASGCYFKAGCYTQSNTDRGDEADAFAQVVIYELRVTHE